MQGHPLKTHEGAGQGKGNIGDPKQGPTGVPYLQGVNVFQSMKNGKVSRDVVTFRMVSSKMMGSGRWVHPGLQAKNFFEDAAEWAVQKWNEEIVKKVVDIVVGPP
jgi:hypothetical protein